MYSGYMSPEYAMKCVFSIKSDVYNFGVIMLEIVSGRKNNLSSPHYAQNLVRCVCQINLNLPIRCTLIFIRSHT